MLVYNLKPIHPIFCKDLRKIFKIKSVTTDNAENMVLGIYLLREYDSNLEDVLHTLLSKLDLNKMNLKNQPVKSDIFVKEFTLPSN
ncbi:unnamed protein product [Brachionus calyciflorus]|uniref:Uncharacterized protein n=1 Tax=Brachionus calyciflorus TaxID=104777 RepID=A0A814PWR1_9BILA|nr:unnamed protein product [Brachionus calyciflorus]